MQRILGLKKDAYEKVFKRMKGNHNCPRPDLLFKRLFRVHVKWVLNSIVEVNQVYVWNHWSEILGDLNWFGRREKRELL